MDLSRYASLLEIPDDELTTDQMKALESDTPTEVRISPSLAAPVAPAVTSAEPADPVEPATTAAPVTATPAAAPKNNFRTLAASLGLGMEDMLPSTPRLRNESSFAADMGRAGNTIGSAIAGVKPDSKFYDNIEARGAAETADRQKPIDDFTNFKRQLMLKVANDKGKGDPALEDPNSAEYKSAVTYFKSDKILGPRWDAYVVEARAAGTIPSVNTFQKNLKGSNALAAETSITNNQNTARVGDARQERGFTQAEKMEGIRQSNRVAIKTLDEAFKQLGEMRASNVPDYVPAKDSTGKMATPTREDAEKVKFNSYKTEKVTQGLDALMDYVKANPDEASRWNPLTDENSRLSVLYGMVRDAYRVAADYGVPSGNDMKMIDDVVKDPRRFLSIFSGRDMSGFEQLKTETLRERELFAKNRGFVRGGQTEDPMDVVKRRLAPVVPAPALGGPEVKEPAAAAPPPTPPKPGMVRIQDPATGKRGWAVPGALPPGTVEVNDGR